MSSCIVWCSIFLDCLAGSSDKKLLFLLPEYAVPAVPWIGEVWSFQRWRLRILLIYCPPNSVLQSITESVSSCVDSSSLVKFIWSWKGRYRRLVTAKYLGVSWNTSCSLRRRSLIVLLSTRLARSSACYLFHTFLAFLFSSSSVALNFHVLVKSKSNFLLNSYSLTCWRERCSSCYNA